MSSPSETNRIYTQDKTTSISLEVLIKVTLLTNFLDKSVFQP